MDDETSREIKAIWDRIDKISKLQRKDVEQLGKVLELLVETREAVQEMAFVFGKDGAFMILEENRKHGSD